MVQSSLDGLVALRKAETSYSPRLGDDASVLLGVVCFLSINYLVGNRHSFSTGNIPICGLGLTTLFQLFAAIVV